MPLILVGEWCAKTSVYKIYSRTLKTPHHIVSVFSWMVLKSNQHLLIIFVEIRLSQNLTNFISNYRVISDDITLVEPLSNEFTNQLFMIFIWIFIYYVPIMIGNLYRAFEAFSISIRSSSIDIVKHGVSLIRVFAVRRKKAWVLNYPLSAQRRLWSDWADAQADLSLRWAHTHFVSFVVLRLILQHLLFNSDFAGLVMSRLIS